MTPEGSLAAFLDSASRHDSAGMLSVLGEASAVLGLAQVVDAVLFPAMREIGTWWRLDPYETRSERIATEVARQWLEVANASAPGPIDRAPVLLLCGPGDRHTLALEAFAALLRHQLQPCRLLTARTMPQAVVTAVRACGADAMVVVSHLRPHRLAAVQSLEAARALGIQAFYAGAAFGSVAGRRDVPGTYLGTNFVAACATIRERGVRARS
ncbi:MAG: regulatory protein MerR [Jatrophihabitans sp.]|nr:regulatory protein MerR [Jatrophihabitans sp.]